MITDVFLSGSPSIGPIQSWAGQGLHSTEISMFKGDLKISQNVFLFHFFYF